MDLRLINILPPQATQGVQQPSNTQGNAPGLTNLSGIPSGSILSGFIINRDASGNPVLRTESGDITFASSFFLKIGSEVQIRVEQTINNTIARLLTVDGQPPELAEARSSFSSSPDVILSQALLSRGPLPSASQPPSAIPTNNPQNASSITTNASQPQPTITVNGTVIGGAQQESTLRLPEGTQLLLKLITIGAPPSTSSPGAALNASLASYAAYARATGVAVPAQAGAQAASTTGAAPAPAGSAGSIVVPPVTTPVQSPVVVTPQQVDDATLNIATPPSNSTQSNTVQLGANPPAASSPPLSADKLPFASPQPAIATQTAQGNTANTGNVSYAPPATGNAILLQPGQSISGTVIGNETTGEALVQTNFGLIRLQPGTSLPVGSRISFELLGSSIPQTQINAALAADTPAGFNELSRQWTSLAQIFNLLTGRDAASGIDFIQAGMPWLMADNAPAPQSLTTPQNMPSGMLFFLAALKGEDFKSWLGKHNSQWLEDNGHGGLLKKAMSEFLTLARQFNENQPTQQTWQTFIFPVAVEGELQQVRFFVKRDKKQGGNRQEAESEDTRFVVEVDVSQLGEIQMDGFVRKTGENPLHFDLVIRTKQALPADVQQDIMAIYTSTGELTGYQGNIQFQSVKEFPQHPMDDIAPKPHNTVIV